MNWLQLGSIINAFHSLFTEGEHLFEAASAFSIIGVIFSLCTVASILSENAKKALHFVSAQFLRLGNLLGRWSEKFSEETPTQKEEEIFVPEFERLPEKEIKKSAIQTSLRARTRSAFFERLLVRTNVLYGFAALIILVVVGAWTKQVFEVKKNGPAYVGRFDQRFSPEEKGAAKGVGGPALEAPDIADSEVEDGIIPRIEVVPIPRPDPRRYHRQQTHSPWDFPQFR